MAEKYQMYIDGEWCDSSSKEVIEVYSPSTGELVGTVPKATPEDVNRAIEAASREKENFKFWSDVERGDLVSRIADELEKEADKFARDLVKEQGKSLSQEGYGEVIESAEN
jgi:acyl-CoA reductase-like NAD-dependent aldehyde dehydrogenase